MSSKTSTQTTKPTKSTKKQYSKIGGQQEEVHDSDNENEADGGGDERMKISDIKSFGDFWRWCMTHQGTACPLLVFLGAGVASILLAFISFISVESAYTAAGICGLIAAVFGAYEFRTLMQLIEQVDKYVNLNSEFRQQNAELRKQVDKLENAQNILNDQTIALKKSNAKMQENLTRFEEFNKNASIMGTDNVKGMDKISGMAQTIQAKWHDQMIKSEKEMYQKVFDRYELLDKKEGMNEEEYNTFIANLPDKYVKRLKELGSFAMLSGSDDILDYIEFGAALKNIGEGFRRASEVRRASFIDEEKQ